MTKLCCVEWERTRKFHHRDCKHFTRDTCCQVWIATKGRRHFHQCRFFVAPGFRDCSCTKHHRYHCSECFSSSCSSSSSSSCDWCHRSSSSSSCRWCSSSSSSSCDWCHRSSSSSSSCQWCSSDRSIYCNDCRQIIYFG